MDCVTRHRNSGILYGGGFRNIKSCDESVVPFYKIFHLDEQYAFNLKEGPAWIENRFFRSLRIQEGLGLLVNIKKGWLGHHDDRPLGEGCETIGSEDEDNTAAQRKVTDGYRRGIGSICLKTLSINLRWRLLCADNWFSCFAFLW